MKHCIIFIYLLVFPFIAAANTTVKDSLINALQASSSARQKLETMTNLMDISRQEEQVDYAKQLYHLAWPKMTIIIRKLL